MPVTLLRGQLKPSS